MPQAAHTRCGDCRPSVRSRLLFERRRPFRGEHKRRGDGGATTGSGSGGSDAGTPDASPWSCKAPYERKPYTQPPDDAVALASLLEAAGYGSAANSDWIDMAAADLCGDGKPEVVLLKNAHSYFSILGGPTPHPIGSADLGSSAAHPWRGIAAADLDGAGPAEIVAVRKVTAAGVPDVIVARADQACVPSVVASAVVGGVGASDWVDVAAGDFDGDGKREIVAGRSPAHLAVVRLAGTSLNVQQQADLTGIAGGWKALGAGDLDGDGRDELVVARHVTDGVGKTVVAYAWNGTAFTEIASSNLGNTGNSDWAGLAVADFNGDGRASIALVKDAHDSFIVLDLPSGAGGQLEVRASSDLVTASGQSWRGLAAADWVGDDAGAAELLALRAKTGAYRADVFVYGNPWQRALRDAALAGTEAQYAGEPHPDPQAPADITTLRDWLTTTHAGTYNYLLWDETGQDYLDLVRFLDATADFCVDNQQLRVWVTLVPPTEHANGRCSRPAESPLTDFSEASFFAGGLGESACEDYAGWAALLGRLAQRYPHLVAVNVDDLSHNLDTKFTPELVADMESRMRESAPWLSLVPTFYYEENGTPSAVRYPDVGLTLDSLLFYFRNEKQGEGPCSACSTPKPCTGACLAGTCAEATVANFPGEAAEMASMLAPGRALEVGVYFTAHSACGEPSPAYDEAMLKAALANPAVGGVTVYTTHHPAGDCAGSAAASDKGCVIAKVFGNH